ncbi:MAG: Na(+)/H(+) antiporter subunit C, partial [Rhodococcus sp. (in: high G+C Gram-positive bacteria)]
SFGGDAFDSRGNPIPIEELKNREDLECYEDLHDGDFEDDEDELHGLDGLDNAEMSDREKRESDREEKKGETT